MAESSTFFNECCFSPLQGIWVGTQKVGPDLARSFPTWPVFANRGGPHTGRVFCVVFLRYFRDRRTPEPRCPRVDRRLFSAVRRSVFSLVSISSICIIRTAKKRQGPRPGGTWSPNSSIWEICGHFWSVVFPMSIPAPFSTQLLPPGAPWRISRRLGVFFLQSAWGGWSSIGSSQIGKAR